MHLISRVRERRREITVGDPRQKQGFKAEVTPLVQSASHQRGQNQRPTIPSVGRMQRNSQPPLVCVKQFARCFLLFKVTHDSPAIPFLGIYPRGMKTYVCAKICWQMFTAALFIPAKRLETPRMSTDRSTDEQAEVHSLHGAVHSRYWELVNLGMPTAEKQHPDKGGRAVGFYLHEILQKARLTRRDRNQKRAWWGRVGSERAGIPLGPSGWKGPRLWWAAGPGPTHVSGTQAAGPAGCKRPLGEVRGQVVPPPVCRQWDSPLSPEAEPAGLVGGMCGSSGSPRPPPGRGGGKPSSPPLRPQPPPGGTRWPI